MATLDEHGHEWLDQTPVAIPFHIERPEPIHVRMRRIAEAFYQEQKNAGDDLETLEEANDFDVQDDPSCGEPYAEPDYLPPVPETQSLNGPLNDEELAAAREFILNRRQSKEKQNAELDGAVSSAPDASA